jgi:hypothetical protein
LFIKPNPTALNVVRTRRRAVNDAFMDATSNPRLVPLPLKAVAVDWNEAGSAR